MPKWVEWLVYIGVALLVAVTNYWWFFICHCPWWLH